MGVFSYDDNTIGQKELVIALPSMVIATGMLTLPKVLASDTVAADGWIPLVAGGLVSVVIAYFIAKLTAGFAGQTFLEYASLIISKPLACVFTFGFAVIAFLIAAMEVRQIADISKHYLFNRTPLELIALTFLFVVIYAVSGSRVGLLRLNIMFLPIILIILVLLLLFNMKWFEIDNMLPMFQTEWKKYPVLIGKGMASYVGYGIIWFYITLVRKPEKIEGKVFKVMFIPIIVYLMVYLACMAVFGNAVTSNLIYPVVELAKEAVLPGGIFERFESIFFVIWIMAIFTTAAMAFDIAVFAMGMLLKKVKKQTFVFWLAPMIYITAMLPQNIDEVARLTGLVSYSAFGYTIFLLVLLAIVMKIRGVKGNG